MWLGFLFPPRTDESLRERVRDGPQDWQHFEDEEPIDETMEGIYMSEPNGDKRSVATDALETLGMIIDAAQKRDAIHLAVEPIEAGEKLWPGMDVGVFEGKAYREDGPHSVRKLGIVDPFLPRAVQQGERFWLVIYPRQIHSLRHVWTHPAFSDAPELADLKQEIGLRSLNLAIDAQQSAKQRSEAWLRAFCGSNDCPSYEFIIEAVTKSDKRPDYGKDDYKGWEISGDYFMVYGTDAHCEIPPEFWTHIETVTGLKMRNKPDHFGCSC